MGRRLFVAVTDDRWYEFLQDQPDVDEVNFWQPGKPKGQFRAVSPGELFLFKLHSPRNFIVGGGVFSHYSCLPICLAWEAFGPKNGTDSFTTLLGMISKYRGSTAAEGNDFTIGCILLSEPFFLPRSHWIPIPRDWAPNIVRGKTYDSDSEEGSRLFYELEERLHSISSASQMVAEPPPERYGAPILQRPRLGQGSFRVLVLDAYSRRCAVTGERTVPVLQSAHIKPYSKGGDHSVANGLLLRSDIHLLFDKGLVTITPDYHFEVSNRIREEWENGRIYYALHGSEINRPACQEWYPDRNILEWHNNSVFKG
jgi:putative restriction endonuclease